MIERRERESHNYVSIDTFHVLSDKYLLHNIQRERERERERDGE
jgi:hypothetical protein